MFARFLIFVASALAVAGCDPDRPPVVDERPVSRLAQREANTQRLLIRVKLSNDMFGTDAEMEKVLDLGTRLGGVIAERDLGEFDGQSFAGGFGELLFFGPSAQRMFEEIRSELIAYGAPRGSYAMIREGGFGVKNRRVDWIKQ
jgi:hypothetical protein